MAKYKSSTRKGRVTHIFPRYKSRDGDLNVTCLIGYGSLARQGVLKADIVTIGFTVEEGETKASRLRQSGEYRRQLFALKQSGQAVSEANLDKLVKKICDQRNLPVGR